MKLQPLTISGATRWCCGRGRSCLLGCLILALSASQGLAFPGDEPPDEIGAEQSQAGNPYGYLDQAASLGRGRTTAELRQLVAKIEVRIAALDNDTAAGPERAGLHLLIAELLKRAGDYDAESHYQAAIEESPGEAAYRHFYSDYLRVYRGAGSPCFPGAEELNFEALEIIKDVGAPWDDATRRRVGRALISLYETDGFPLGAIFDTGRAIGEPFREPPYGFLSTRNRYARATSDLPEVDDVRDFTSEALFAESPARLNRELTDRERRKIVRVKSQFETRNRLRLRMGGMPVVDLTYARDHIDDAQITNFFIPGSFNDVDTVEYGFGLQAPFKLPGFDLFVRGDYKMIEREGVVEFLPRTEEEIDHLEGRAALSRFFGPDKLTVEFMYADQDIDPDLPDPPRRERRMVGGTARYQLFRLASQDPFSGAFETRGLDLLAGVLFDRESYGDTNVRKTDLFFGASLSYFVIPAFRPAVKSFDVTVQGTYFRSTVTGDSTQDNGQVRVDLVLLARLIDEEDAPELPRRPPTVSPAFLHLAIPAHIDFASGGMDEFENWKIGLELSAKLFSTRLGGTSALFTLGYSYQDFHRIDKSVSLFHAGLEIGF